MSDYCKQCSEEMFGKDTEDLAVPTSSEGFEKDGRYAQICEGCGWTVTDENGVCLHCKADKNQIGRLKGRIQELEKELSNWRKADSDVVSDLLKEVAELESKLKSAEAVVEAARRVSDQFSEGYQSRAMTGLRQLLEAYDAQTRSGE